MNAETSTGRDAANEGAVPRAERRNGAGVYPSDPPTLARASGRAVGWSERFDPLAGGVAIGDPLLTRQMRWLPPGITLQPCPASRTGHSRVEPCTQPAGHPGARHITAMGVVFEACPATEGAA